MKKNTQHTSKQFLIKKNPQRMVENIPEELKMLTQWVVWRKATRDGKLTKVPYNPDHSNKKAKTNDPLTWGTLQEACQVAETGQVGGMGFVFTKEGPYLGVDLDKCRDP